MNGRISIGEVKDLDGGKFSVRLSIESPKAALAQTQIVSADGYDTAVQIAKLSFSRWLEKARRYALNSAPRDAALVQPNITQQPRQLAPSATSQAVAHEAIVTF